MKWAREGEPYAGSDVPQKLYLVLNASLNKLRLKQHQCGVLAHRTADRWVDGKVVDYFQEVGPGKSRCLLILIDRTIVSSRERLR